MIPDTIHLWRGILFWGWFILLLGGEFLFPYRQPTVSKLGRIGVNVALTVLNAVILQWLFFTPTEAAFRHVAENQSGLVNLFAMPYGVKVVLTVLILDFTLYLWHICNHILPVLWRFHRVHHSDLNMDVSTAVRFHIGELMISSLINLGLIIGIGADAAGVFLFESLLGCAVQFQHSSLRVPERWERIFWTLFVPPSMHRIHHSVVIAERNTNYGSILSIWDRLCGTLLKDIDQERITIGVGAYREPEKLRFPHLLRMPFTKTVP